MSRRFLAAALALAVAAIAVPAHAHDYQAASLAIRHPWARPTPPAAPVAGGYLTVTNSGPAADRLLGGTSEFAARVEIHRSSVTDGIASMRPVPDGVEIPAGGTVALEPGAMHLMFIKPVRPLKVGESVPVTLQFANAGAVVVEFTVQAGKPQADPHAGHGAP